MSGHKKHRKHSSKHSDDEIDFSQFNKYDLMQIGLWLAVFGVLCFCAYAPAFWASFIFLGRH